MELKIFVEHPDRSNSIFATENGQRLLDAYDGFYSKVGFNFPWISYLIVRENQLLGCCSFVGKPIDGRVEIAYWTFAEFEGQGVASYACQELVAIAKKEEPSIKLTAKTAPMHNASTKILQKNKFTFTKIVQDHEIGDAWLWELEG